jgi:hypothetical protein
MSATKRFAPTSLPPDKRQAGVDLPNLLKESEALTDDLDALADAVTTAKERLLEKASDDDFRVHRAYVKAAAEAATTLLKTAKEKAAAGVIPAHGEDLIAAYIKVAEMPSTAEDQQKGRSDKDESQSESRRFNIELPPSSVQRLNRLKRIIEASSYAEVIRNALRIYEALVDALEKGAEVFLRDKDGKITSLRIFGP